MTLTRRQLLLAGLPGAAWLSGCGARSRVQRDPFVGRRRVSLIGQGTYTLGDDPQRRQEELIALRLGLDLGLGHIDTAEMYGDGRSESLVGEAIRGRRGQVFLSTKIRPDRASYAGTLEACDESLARLGTDHLDLYLLHMPPTRYPLEETLRAFDELVRRGKVRAIGVSNFETPALLDEARRLARSPLACNQIKHSLLARHLQSRLEPTCRALGIALVGYTPFADFPSAGPGLVALETVARARGASTHQVALAFLAKDGVLQIPRASRPEHVRDNAGALHLHLTPADLTTLELAFPA